jgi:hypothetical protein
MLQRRVLLAIFKLDPLGTLYTGSSAGCFILKIDRKNQHIHYEIEWNGCQFVPS